MDVPGRCPVFARETVCNLPSPKYRFCATQLAKLEAALGRPLVRLQSNESARPPRPKVRRSMGVMQGRAQGDFRGRLVGAASVESAYPALALSLAHES